LRVIVASDNWLSSESRANSGISRLRGESTFGRINCKARCGHAVDSSKVDCERVSCAGFVDRNAREGRNPSTESFNNSSNQSCTGNTLQSVRSVGNCETRSWNLVHIEKVQTDCGWSVADEARKLTKSVACWIDVEASSRAQVEASSDDEIVLNIAGFVNGHSEGHLAINNGDACN